MSNVIADNEEMFVSGLALDDREYASHFATNELMEAELELARRNEAASKAYEQQMFFTAITKARSREADTFRDHVRKLRARAEGRVGQ